MQGEAAPSGPPPERPRPYIPAEVVLPELTFLPLAAGTVLGIIFGASSLYLVLKVGLTVSASIPVAVISITLFRLLAKFGLRQRSILENNIVQTAGSAGESIAFGIGVTMPAVLILGFDLEVMRAILVSVLGGLLGILMMIPLRRALIVQQHDSLKYPEGTACAEVLKAGATAEERRIAAGAAAMSATSATSADNALPDSGARTIFTGFGIGLLYKTLYKALYFWKEIPERDFKAPFEGGSVSVEISPELLGVGYVIGPRIASIMCAGGVLAYLVLIPAIKFFGKGLAAVLPPGTMPIAEMGPDDIRSAYVLYIGAGAVAAGGVISLVRSLPTIWAGMRGGLADLRRRRSRHPQNGAAAAASAATLRTDQDLSMRFVLGGSIALVAMIMLASSLRMNLLGAVLIVVFGFLFVTVSSRLTGEIGSSSNPISGMTVATLLLTCLIFLALGWTGPPYYVTALSVGAIVCIAASNGGTTSQDLKTGYLIGSTPSHQQVAILVGSLASSIVLGPILLALNDSATVYVPRVTFEATATAAGGATDASAGAHPGALPTIPATVAATLPAYGGPPPPIPGSYRVLHVGAGGTGNAAAAVPAPEVAASSAAPVPKDLPPGEYLVAAGGSVAYRVSRNFPPELRAVPAQLGGEESLRGPQARRDPATYRVWQKPDETGGPQGRYLVDRAGVPVYLVDPGINGTHPLRPDGTRVTKYSAPKATLMSYIIKGILNRQLPWALVLLGVMIAVTLEMSGATSLAFAVGVYLPLSSTSPIFIGGLVRWLIDLHLRRQPANRGLDEEQLTAVGDRGPGVLMASGYIAGGAIAGILIAFSTGVLTNFDDFMTRFMTAHNRLFSGPHEDALSLLPFAALVILLYLTGRELVIARRRTP